jgi:hypothetical protein
MASYLYPEMASKKAYREAIANGKTITARENTPWGQMEVKSGSVPFEGPHFPKPHKYCGIATVVNGVVTAVK